jgi:hypothetical protein
MTCSFLPSLVVSCIDVDPTDVATEVVSVGRELVPGSVVAGALVVPSVVMAAAVVGPTDLASVVVAELVLASF